MTAALQRGVLLVVAAALTVCAGGCFQSRAALYSDIEASRQLAYKRWMEAAGEENLPKLEGKLSMADAVRTALVYSKTLAQVEQQKEVARGQILEAYSGGLPTIEFDADYTRLDMVQSIDIGTTSFTLGNVNNYSAGLTVTQPLFKGAVLPAVRGARIFRYMSDEAVRKAVQDVVLTVAEDYYRVLLADELYKVQEAALQFAQANLQDVLAREKQGVAIRYDELRARLEVSTVKADLISQRNARSRAFTALFRAMGASQQSQVELTDALAYRPMEPSFERAVQIAFSNRPDVISSELDVRLQREILLGLWSDYLPKLEAWGTTGWAKPDPHDSTKDRWGSQWQAGLRLTWVLFDGLSREGKLVQQKAVARQSAITLSDT
jgi:outer membrane protein TolC